MKIHVQNRQRTIKVNIGWLRRFGSIALLECAQHSADGGFALTRLPEIEVAIVSDRVIARVHKRFMHLGGPTDVITFQHGEIVMSGETAAACAAEHGHAIEMELALYTVHGLLHLNGYEDGTAKEANRMRKTQERILNACLARRPGP